MVLHLQIDGQPRDYLRSCTTGVKTHEIENLFFQATKPSLFLCTFGHNINLSPMVFEEGKGEPQGAHPKSTYCNGSMIFQRGSASFFELGPERGCGVL